MPIPWCLHADELQQQHCACFADYAAAELSQQHDHGVERPAGQKLGWKLGLLGVLSSFVCGFCNTGVLVGTYLSKVTDNTQTFEANACVVYFLSDSIRLLMFICLGVLNRAILWETLSIFPVAMLELWLGMKSSKIMNDAIARKIVLVMLIFSSLGLVFNNLQKRIGEI